MNKEALIFVAGHNGLVGSALVRALQAKGYHNLLLKNHRELDLELQSEVTDFFSQYKPEYVFLAAAKVGGILYNNTHPAEFIYSNLLIQTNVIHAAYKFRVKNLLFLGSSCIYPKFAKQPLKEEYLLTGGLESTNESYALAKIAGIKMCEAYNRQYGTKFIAVMPSNLYGPNDNFDLKNSHVLPAMIRKFHEAKIAADKTDIELNVTFWGTGQPKREFLYADDLADACLFLMNLNEEQLSSVFSGPNKLINIGTGSDLTIAELAVLISNVVGYKGKITWDSSFPDGVPRKVLDVSKINSAGWKHKTKLEHGIKTTYKWYVQTI